METNIFHSENKTRVLLVEDEFIAQKVGMGILTKLNCETDLAVNGKEALEKADNDYHLILMDMGLPDMTGAEVIAQIRQQKKNHSIPIIVLTAYSDEETVNRCKAAGADATYFKPINQETFQKILTQYVKS
jgi:CheY-like chemotaxis protein